ncbi:carbohydrate kinase [Cutibacterium acnes JCM 18920]|nr:carbohydrate kinase [Cutibacterium acnes JCM 18920]
MSLTTTPEDVLRSVYEGVALSLADCVAHLAMTGDLVVSGGGFSPISSVRFWPMSPGSV